MQLIYFGTYTKKNSKGIYSARFDETNGRLADVQLAAMLANPSFLAVHPNRRFLYAVSELDNYHHESCGAVVAFAIDHQTGELSLLNEVASRGAWPCHLTVDSSGKNVIVANYGGGNVAILRIGENGLLSNPPVVVQHAGSGGPAEAEAIKRAEAAAAASV
jgi:6-phosphogluconolactonase